MTTDLPLEPGWSWRKTYWVLYPFTAGAVAINLFMAGLLGQWLGLPAIPPVLALLASVPLGLPVNWPVTNWIRGLIDEAEGRR